MIWSGIPASCILWKRRSWRRVSKNSEIMLEIHKKKSTFKVSSFYTWSEPQSCKQGRQENEDSASCAFVLFESTLVSACCPKRLHEDRAKFLHWFAKNTHRAEFPEFIVCKTLFTRFEDGFYQRAAMVSREYSILTYQPQQIVQICS